MTAITPEQLAEWERLANEATPGEWEVNYRNDAFVLPKGSLLDGIGSAVFACQVPNSPNYRRDAKFIAASRTAVPALIARVRELEAENERTSEALREYQKFNRIHNDLEAYLYHYGQWAFGEETRKPNPRSFGVNQ